MIDPIGHYTKQGHPCKQGGNSVCLGARASNSGTYLPLDEVFCHCLAVFRHFLVAQDLVDHLLLVHT
jgi:hypothetical protein